MTVQIVVRTNMLPSLSRSIAARAKAEVKQATDAIAAAAQSAAPVETGELRASIAETKGEVVASSDHAGYVEFGTVHMAAQPFLTPAAEAERPRFVDRMRKVADL